MKGMTHTAMDQQMQACIDECTTCHQTCIQTIGHCLQMGGEHAEPDHIRLLMDCVHICQTSADFMTRMSPMHGRVCGICAEICEQCAEDCERFENDAMMERCARECRRCADSCHGMANA